MNVRPVLVEKENKKEGKILGCSGIMLQEKYIIITANILLDEDGKNISEKLKPGTLYPELSLDYNIPINVVWNENELYVVKKAYIFSPFVSKNIKTSSKHIFQNWAIDSIDNNVNLNEILSLFFVLSFDKVYSIEDFKNTLKDWWYLLGGFDVSKGDEIYIRSTPFGNRNFVDSYSKGIVSNVMGNNFCLILSDCPSTPGSEGSPVYFLNSELPIGLVLSSVSWWRGEWIGLTLIADIRPIISELIDIPLRKFNIAGRIDNLGIIATTEFSLVQVYCGKNWGTAILLCKEKGIFVTNSHVIEEEKINLFHKSRSWKANLLYRTPDNNVLDLALIQSEADVLKDLRLKSVKVSKRNYKLGDCVFSAGFSLFTKDCQPSPTLTKGNISQINPYMVKTTCCVHAGASGGAILDDEGALIAIIVCNVKLHDNNVIYPRVNMAIPFPLVADIVFRYIKTQDLTILNNLSNKKQEAEYVWKRLEGKL